MTKIEEYKKALWQAQKDDCIGPSFAETVATWLDDLWKDSESLHETFTDMDGTVWTRPTAWAYAQTCKTLHRHDKRLEAALAALQQVDDVLVVNWIPVKGGDYRKALGDLVTCSIQEYNDPSSSATAKDREDTLKLHWTHEGYR